MALASARKMIEEMALNELRQAMGITQERLTKALRINQAGVSKIESRSDIFVSTLRKRSKRWMASWKFAQSFLSGELRIGQFGGLGRRRRARSGVVGLVGVRSGIPPEEFSVPRVRCVGVVSCPPWPS